MAQRTLFVSPPIQQTPMMMPPQQANSPLAAAMIARIGQPMQQQSSPMASLEGVPLQLLKQYIQNKADNTAQAATVKGWLGSGAQPGATPSPDALLGAPSTPADTQNPAFAWLNRAADTRAATPMSATNPEGPLQPMPGSPQAQTFQGGIPGSPGNQAPGSPDWMQQLKNYLSPQSGGASPSWGGNISNFLSSLPGYNGSSGMTGG